MNQQELIALLTRSPGYLSGQEMSQTLGVTRGAVWKEICALREQGWPISSSTRLGYRLEGPPPCLSQPYLEALLPPDSLCKGKIRVLEQVDSTNTYLKALAAQGAPEGTVVAALEQTGGRGTRGRIFASPPGGLYLSLLLRPSTSLDKLFSLTGWVAVAVARAIDRAWGTRCEVKWLNDIYLGGKKLCGILTELSLLGESYEPDYGVVGVGINLTHSAQTIQGLGLEGIATSLALEGQTPEVNAMALHLMAALEELYASFPQGGEEYLAEYRARCLTLGRRVSFDRGEGVALEVGENFSLLVEDAQGKRHTITSGTVTLLPTQPT